MNGNEKAFKKTQILEEKENTMTYLATLPNPTYFPQVTDGDERNGKNVDVSNVLKMVKTLISNL